MLGEGQRRRSRGADVVIAFAESHGRPVTEQRMADLEVVPGLAVEYRGSTFREMDLDGVLRRRPQVALVDELAHTNVPGSGRNAKRWQDITELLDAGIAVITTVNIQHLDSVADTVERITGVPVRERVPDWAGRRADQIELVDSSPEQLRRRMLHGNIYPAEQVPGALTRFFRADNLAALRELALRFLADQTGAELSADLARHETHRVPSTSWPASPPAVLGKRRHRPPRRADGRQHRRGPGRGPHHRPGRRRPGSRPAAPGDLRRGRELAPATRRRPRWRPDRVRPGASRSRRSSSAPASEADGRT